VLCAIHSAAVDVASHNALPRQRRNLACHNTELAKKREKNATCFGHFSASSFHIPVLRLLLTNCLRVYHN
jgi:hypothetical protein